MNQYIEFTYETVAGDVLEIKGTSNGLKVRFDAKTDSGKSFSKSKLTTIDVRNIQDFILDNSEPEVEHYNDIDYRYD